jgi:hypothetical protein
MSACRPVYTEPSPLRQKVLLAEKIPLAAVSGFPYLNTDSAEFDHTRIVTKQSIFPSETVVKFY